MKIIENGMKKLIMKHDELLTHVVEWV